MIKYSPHHVSCGSEELWYLCCYQRFKFQTICTLKLLLLWALHRCIGVAAVHFNSPFFSQPFSFSWLYFEGSFETYLNVNDRAEYHRREKFARLQHLLSLHAVCVCSWSKYVEAENSLMVRPLTRSYNLSVRHALNTFDLCMKKNKVVISQLLESQLRSHLRPLARRFGRNGTPASSPELWQSVGHARTHYEMAQASLLANSNFSHTSPGRLLWKSCAASAGATDCMHVYPGFSPKSVI